MKRVLATSFALAGAAAAVGTVLAGIADPAGTLAAWTAAYGFAFSTAASMLVLVFVADLASATWFAALRPLATAISGTFPVLVAAFVPVPFALRALRPWTTSPEALASLEEPMRRAVEHHRAWMSLPLVVVRSIVYLAVFCALAWLARRDATESARKKIAGPGLVGVGFALTFASFDWMMSFQPGWQSAVYGMYVFAGGFTSAVGVLAIATWAARSREVLPAEVGPEHAHALGRVMLVGVSLWAYLAYSQLLLVWITDLPRETSFYADRIAGGWARVSALLVVGRFAVPMLLLFSRRLKRMPAFVAAIGAWSAVMHAVDSLWLVAPASRGGPTLFDVAPFVAPIAFAAAFAIWRFAPSSVDAARPAVRASLEYESP